MNRALSDAVGASPSRVERFLAKTTPVPEAGCWLWTGASHPTGYGRFGITSTRVEFAHRAAWLLFRGPIPAGMYVCHKCDVPLCVNPDHLFIGSATDNMRDASRKGRIRLPRASFASSGAHQPAKLTDDQVREIRASKAGSFALARDYGVRQQTIWKARTGRTFRDVI